ncbi:carboxymuconolactone decarboxylase family protein [Tenacibaculum agarivorans]|uniref:carboxymuconolactone decarboxylase family protein n=1 Tax=Tenacibaculum agarivorans TaxID=1908389 RepID=UPI00094BA92D|nr:peroxidase-related enzyme [Tenacibaculum agarivorans]
MSWIEVISFDKAKGKLKSLYEKVTGPNNNVDNIMMIHSLRPHTMVGHMAIYKNVLHNSANKLPKWYLETLGVYVSMLNKCDYCIEHHFEGLKRLLNDDEKSKEIRKELENDSFKSIEKEGYQQGLLYAKKLTLYPNQLVKNDIVDLKEKGITEGEILEINQVVSYFNYANRTVLGLGVTTKGDILGLSPSSSEDNNWKHQ